MHVFIICIADKGNKFGNVWKRGNRSTITTGAMKNKRSNGVTKRYKRICFGKRGKGYRELCRGHVVRSRRQKRHSPPDHKTEAGFLSDA